MTQAPPATPADTSDAALAFEVASVKPNNSAGRNVRLQIQPGGRFTATNVSLREIIRAAYQVQPFQIVGGPGWMNSDRFDIVAKAESDFPQTPPGGPPGPLQLMLRSLLAERFNLTARTESRDMPIYELVLAREDGRLGEGLQPSAVDCAGGRQGPGRGAAPPAPGERPNCGMRIGPGVLSAGGMPLSQFANGLAPMVERVVIDRTGLSGNFDLDLEWTPDQQLAQGPFGGPDLPPVDPNGPSIFTAVQEQLGLKLESGRGPVDVLVIDSVEQPTPD